MELVSKLIVGGLLWYVISKIFTHYHENIHKDIFKEFGIPFSIEKKSFLFTKITSVVEKVPISHEIKCLQLQADIVAYPIYAGLFAFLLIFIFLG